MQIFGEVWDDYEENFISDVHVCQTLQERHQRFFIGLKEK